MAKLVLILLMTDVWCYQT